MSEITKGTISLFCKILGGGALTSSSNPVPISLPIGKILLILKQKEICFKSSNMEITLHDKRGEPHWSGMRLW